MNSLQNYRGLDVLASTATGSGGEAINNDFKKLVDWNPKCNWAATNSPTAGDDSSDPNYYEVGSRWFNSNSGALYLCVDASEDAAVWRGVSYGSLGLTAWNSTFGTVTKSLFLDGNAETEEIVVPNGTTWAFTVTAAARLTGSTAGTSAVWEVKGAIKRTASGTSLVGSNSPLDWKETAAASWALSVVVGSNNNLDIQVTGAAKKTITWSANVIATPLTI